MRTAKETILHSINASPDKAWKVIGQGSGVDKWFSSLIKTCRLDGDKRYCETVDGIQLEEEIHEINHTTRTFRFSITKQNLLPVRNIAESIRVIPDGLDKSIIEWSVMFDLEGENEDEFKKSFRDLFISGLTDLETFVNQQ